jgi:hypothetical protein
MADPRVQQVREWLRSQPFELRMITLLLFLEEAVEEKFGKEAMNDFDKDLKKAYRKVSGWLPSPQGKA